jgi:hypothetical protein
MIKKLLLLSILATGWMLLGVAPAQAQSTVPVTLTLFKGNTILKSHAMTSVEWHGNFLYIYGAKEANNTNKYYCVLQSTKQDVLLGLYNALSDPKLSTVAVCRAPSTHNSSHISVDLENPGSMKFGISAKR